MTTDINTIVAVSGKITFTVKTDEDGCSEDFSTTIEGTKFASHLTLGGPGPHPGQSIRTNPKSGPHVVTVTAETSHVSSRPTPVVLVAAQAGGGA